MTHIKHCKLCNYGHAKSNHDYETIQSYAHKQQIIRHEETEKDSADTKGNYGVMCSILACTMIGFNATMSGFTLMHELSFDNSFTDINHVNINKSKTCGTGDYSIVC